MIESPQIHQYIFAGPRPGLSAVEFQDYWVHTHAVQYASKIPQIQRYLVGTREGSATPQPMAFFEGVAEIWLENEAEQLASLQTPQFLDGARADEPRWAAFWRTFVLDTGETVVKQAAGAGQMSYLKAYLLLKRAAGSSLDTFAEAALAQAAAAAEREELAGCTVGLARRSLYGFGEPRFDGIAVWSFHSCQAALNALADLANTWSFADPEAFFTMLAREHWIVPAPQQN